MTSPNMKIMIERIFINLFICILCAVGLAYVYLMLTAPVSLERLQYLISVDAFAATIGGICFYASYTSKDEKRKQVYFMCAENFFHAFILFFVTTILRGCILILDDFSWFMSLKAYILIFLRFMTVIFFVYGFLLFISGLRRMLAFIFEINSHSIKA